MELQRGWAPIVLINQLIKMNTLSIIFGIFLALTSLTNQKTDLTPAEKQQTVSHDTIRFEENEEAGWLSLQSYVHQVEDSVHFEVLLSREVPTGTDWTAFTLVGRIDSTYAPVIRRDFEYNQPNRKWAVSIIHDGRCYLRWIGGSEPEHPTFFLPLFTKYKK